MSPENNKKGGLAEIAVDAPITGTLTYRLPPEMDKKAAAGQRVLVPLGNRRVTGYIMSFPEKPPVSEKQLRDVISIIDPEPLLSGKQLDLFKWAARYYFAPIGEVIKTSLPAGINVASKRTARLTETGRKELMKNDDAPAEGLSSTDHVLLETLREKGPAAVTRLCSRKGISESRLEKLAKKGMIELSQELPGPRVKEKTERLLTLCRDPSPEELAGLERRAPQQARLIKELSDREAVPFSELRKSYKDPARLAGKLASAGLVKETETMVSRDPFSLELPLEPPPEKLMPEQEEAVERMSSAMDDRGFRVFLLRGVTGSGKTEVYLQLIRKALDNHQGAIMMVPEIALTPQLLARFRQRFDPSLLAVLHSGLSPGERYDQWRRIKKGEARVVIGARSAVFAPLPDTGIIVVDEEHEGAYKQDHGFMYQGRDLAIMRAKKEGAVVVLGSATPSLESACRCDEGGYVPLTLTKRVVGRPLPEIELIDLRKEKRDKGDAEEEDPVADLVKDRDRMFAEDLVSDRLREELESALSRGEQSILFINRRGIFSFMICFDCGRRFICENCEVSLTYHRSSTSKAVDNFYGEPAEGGYLLCHYCGYHTPVPEVCPHCRGVRIRPFGAGTEQLEEAVVALFPQARVKRVDSDAMGSRESYFRLIDQVCRHEIDILVGTQMLAKGHDLPGVTLVGVLMADNSLNMPDFRASERTFQMLTQVAGRAGRGDAPGKVIIQTFQPEHYAIRLALEGDYESFYKEEAERRKALWYPPFARLVNMRFSGLDRDAVRATAMLAGRTAKQISRNKAYQGKVRILGPASAPIARIKGKSRWMLLIKADTPGTLTAFCEHLGRLMAKKEKPKGVTMEIDRDPVSMM
ncbi:MAG: primosomal protein N' [bacterium]